MSTNGPWPELPVATVKALRDLCPHGGDESAGYVGPGRSGVCDACAAQLLGDRAVLGDLLKERGLESMLMQARAALKATLWLLENSEPSTASHPACQPSDHAHAVKLINEALTHLPRPPGHDLTHAQLLKLATPVPPTPLAPPAWYPGAPPGRYTMTSAQMAAMNLRLELQGLGLLVNERAIVTAPTAIDAAGRAAPRDLLQYCGLCGLTHNGLCGTGPGRGL